MPEQTAMTRDEFLEALDRPLEEHSMLKAPFYQAWAKGKLDIVEHIAPYALQYGPIEDFVPDVILIIRDQCDQSDVTDMLSQAWEDEVLGPNEHPSVPWHTELWRRFADEMGVARQDWDNLELLDGTQEALATFGELAANPDFRVGVAALYAYERQIVDVARTKREAMEQHYGMQGSPALQFFSEHEVVDKRHSDSEREILATMCLTREQQMVAIQAVETMARALRYDFLDSVQSAYYPSL
jgi:pyrroloquinoline-quinone synthase